jgi:Xaa-Pro aminopeptidase
VEVEGSEQVSTLSAPANVDSAEISGQRLARFRAEMTERNIGACVLCDPVNVRFVTGSRNMQVYISRNPARYAFIPHEGPIVMFEYPGARHLAEAEPLIDEVRPAIALTYLASGYRLEEMARRWAGEIADLARSCGSKSVAVDALRPQAVTELNRCGIEVVDAQAALEMAKSIKSTAEIAAMRTSLQVVADAVARLRESIVPGISEVQLWATLHEQTIANGGEYVETRLLSAGPRTNPWFHEASSYIIEAGDLVALDTDVVGPGGFYTDFSRTFLCGTGKATDKQRRLYELALQQVEHNMALLRPGVSFREVTEKSWPIPDEYVARRYACLAHGVGLTGEYPHILFREDYDEWGYDGLIHERMVLCIESYIGAEGGREGVKLEQQVLIGPDGPELMMDFPWEEALL